MGDRNQDVEEVALKQRGLFSYQTLLWWSLCDAVQIMTFLCLGNEGVSGDNKSLPSQFFYLHGMKTNKAAGNTLPMVLLNVCLLKKLNMLQCSEYKITEYIANVGIFLATIV